MGAYLMVGWGYDLYRFNYERSVVRWARPGGVRLQFADRVVIKDHGPQTLGGWHPVELHAGDTIIKQLALPEVQTTGENKVRVRLLLLSVMDTRLPLRVMVNDNPSSASETQLALSPGMNWVEVESGVFTNPSTSSIMAVTLQFADVPASINLIFDDQRYYERTQINGQTHPEEGELVMELVLKL
jgi:hypothetical protein